MSKVSQVMNWIDNLPAINGSEAQRIIFAKKREAVAAIMERAHRLEVQAMEIRNEAYLLSLRIESEARGLWSAAEIEAAKQQHA